jgi:flagellar biosynthesis protein FlhB
MSVMSTLVTQVEEHARRLARDVQHHCTNAQTHVKNVLRDANINSKAALYSVLLFVAFTYLSITIVRLVRIRRQNTARPSTPNLEKRSPFKAPDRPFGGKQI